MRFLVINGPNLNMLGTREPEIYGSESLTDLERQWRMRATQYAIGIHAVQSNHEGELIDVLHGEGTRADGVIINPGALSHYSYALHDAIAAITVPVVEVHISNIHERESWRRTSVTAPAAERVIVGRGPRGYLDAIDHLRALLTHPPVTVSYGDGADQVIDIRVPRGANGTVALIHGGFWRSIWARDIMDPLAVHLADRGWATANIEYRRGAGSFASSQADIAAAMASLPAHIGSAAQRTVAVGHSAGGYLALRQAIDGGGVPAIALAPVIDLDAISRNRVDDDPISTYLGATRTEDPSLWDAAAMPGELGARAVIIHGDADEAVPVEHSIAYATSTGLDLTTLPGVDHMSLIDPTSPAADALLTTLEAFFGATI
jgi:3-dehydroquinate dehydratase-2